MALILIAIIALIILSLVGTQLDYDFLSELVCPLFATIGFVALTIYGFLVFGYTAAEYQAGIINREYGTNYTQKEVFYASSVIETVRELDRKRVEVNGNLVTGK